MLLFSGVYYTLTTWIWGATLGKFIFGLRVVRTDDSAVGFTKSALRFLGSVVSTIFGLGYLFIVFRADKRALHDLIAGTRVVFKPR
ncbi:MAG: RDD family protein [Verrucomicrobia bacterium]|nr:RDD family protein [Verrucomicrobiota bacterium]